jgi:hypothetical protein
MKKAISSAKLSRLMGLALIAAVTALSASGAWADVIDYPDGSSLTKTIPGWVETSLFGVNLGLLSITDNHIYPNTANSNTVTINSNATAIKIFLVAGGQGETTDVKSNDVFIKGTGNSTGGGIGLAVAGALAGDASALNNHVTITSGEVDAGAGGYVYGGYVAGNTLGSSTGAAIGNTVTVGAASGGGTIFIGDTIYGGYVQGPKDTAVPVFKTTESTGAAQGNQVTVYQGTLAEGINGGSSYTGDASGNKVTVSGTAASLIFGNVSKWSMIFGGNSSRGSANDNEVSVTSLGASMALPPMIIGGESNMGLAGTTAKGNKVTISGRVATSAAIAGGGINFYVGGYAQSNATGNSVTLRDANVDNGHSLLIVGARLRAAPGAGSVAHDNTVTLSGSASFTHADSAAPSAASKAVALYGAYHDYSASGVPADGRLVEGNTLVLDRFTGTVSRVANFEKFDFTLPAGLENGHILLNVNGTATLGSATLQPRVVGISIGDASLRVGDTVVLIAADLLETGLPLENDTVATVKDGATATWDLAVVDGRQLTATLKSLVSYEDDDERTLYHETPAANGDVDARIRVTDSSGSPVDVTGIVDATANAAALRALEAIGIDTVDYDRDTGLLLISGKATDIAIVSLILEVRYADGTIGTETIRFEIRAREVSGAPGLDQTPGNWNTLFTERSKGGSRYYEFITDVPLRLSSSEESAKAFANNDASATAAPGTATLNDRATVLSGAAAIQLAGTTYSPQGALITSVSYRVGIFRYTQTLNPPVVLSETNARYIKGEGTGEESDTSGGCAAGAGVGAIIALSALLAASRAKIGKRS